MADEADIAGALDETVARFPAVDVGSYPQAEGGPHRVKVTFDSRDRAQVDAALDFLAGRLGRAVAPDRLTTIACVVKAAMAEVPPGVKGMNDILPPEVSKWQFVEEKARGVLEAFAYREVRTPVLEYTPLFVRSVGEVTDVVEKQMYTFDDRDGRSVSLRPEGTASAVRAYIERAQWNREPVTRWYYIGPMFRHERAQRGRLRQFHQIGAELFGVDAPSADAETIAMLVAMLVDMGLPASELQVNLNSLGEPEERAAYRDALVAFYRGHLEVLDEDSRRRLETNPLRILDSKSPEVVALNANAPRLAGHAGRQVARALRRRPQAPGRAGRAARPARAPGPRPRLLHRDHLRDHDRGRRPRRPEHHLRRRPLRPPGRVAGRARRRRPSASPWASSAPCWPSPSPPRTTSRRSASSSRRWTSPPWPTACRWPSKLRAAGIRCEVEHRGGSMKSQMKRADKLRSRVAIIVGSNEIASNTVTLKDLAKGTQTQVPVAELTAKIHQLLD